MADDPQLTAALNIMRRMPPSRVENSLAGLIELVPDLTDDLLNNVDQPLQVQKDPDTGRDYILCDYNRDGDSYRSPWSNKYFPAMADGFFPTPKLRQMEIEANNVFDTYRKLYFDTGNSSVYFFNTDEKEEESFGACFLIHKDVASTKGLTGGVWDSIHVFEVAVDPKKKDNYTYRLTTTVMVSMAVNNDKVGNVDLSGSMTQQSEQTHACTKVNPHMANMGKMLEDMELKIRNSIEGVYIQKTREVIGGIRSIQLRDAATRDAFNKMTASLNAAVTAHGAGRKKDSD